MEILSSNTPSFVDNVFLTETGKQEHTVLPGTWINFQACLEEMGTLQRALSGKEYVQLRPDAGKVVVKLQFKNASRILADKLPSSPSRIGVARHYPILHAPADGPGSQDDLWIFGSITAETYTLNLRDSEISMSFSGELLNIEPALRLMRPPMGP